MAGRVRLAVTGIQDQWFTGNPDISYFVTNFKRHTRFSTESVEIPFSGDSAFGSTVTCRIPNNIGDLVRSVILKIKLSSTSPDSVTTFNGGTPVLNEYNSYTPSFGKQIIKHADLIIGGQTIERLTGEYIYMYDQLHSTLDDTNLTQYFLSGHNQALYGVNSSRDTFYVNLPFYFFRHPSLSIPVCAITKQLIQVRITFKNADDNVVFQYRKRPEGKIERETLSNETIINTSLITDFYFITDDERNFLLTRPLEYVITQLQKSTLQFKPGEVEKSALLKFQHPVKELLFIATEDMQVESNVVGATYTYTVTVSGGVFVIGGTSNPILSMHRGNTYIFDQSDNSNATHPLLIATTADGSNYSTGVTTEGVPGSTGAKTIFVVPMDAPETLYYKCNNHLGMGNSITTDIRKAHLLLDAQNDDEKMSLTIDKRSDHRFINSISLEFNGATKFDHHRTYLAYQDCLNKHTGRPDPSFEFYTYSFALKPEVYYPTGQVNMSRIIHKKLNVKLDETSTLNNIDVQIYAINYNILRIESGLAGLKF